MNQKHTKRGFSLNRMVILTFILAVLSVSGGYAQYTSAREVSDEARVATMITNITEKQPWTSREINLDLTKGAASKNATYYFSVTNAKDGRISEVDQIYDIVIKFENKALPEGVSVSLDSGSEKSVKGEISPDRQLITFHDVGSFKAGEENKIQHTVTFSAEEDLLIGTNGTIPMKIDVHVEQMQEGEA